MSRLSFAERYETINSREKSIALPIAFLHPVNSAPGEPEFELSVKHYNENLDIYRSDQKHDFWQEYPLSELTMADLDGSHTWRNIYTGTEMVTVTISEEVWSGWVLRPLWDEWTRGYSSPLSYHDDRWCAEHWVLCDALTIEQIYAWEVFRSTSRAIREAHLDNKSEVQIKMF